MANKIVKCKDYRKARGENRCKNFLGYKTICIYNYLTGGDYSYEIKESCKSRCALKQNY